MVRALSFGLGAASIVSWFLVQASAQENLAMDERLAWWRDARFGMFIHWGPVALKGTEIGWSRGVEVPVEEYDTLYREFNPTEFNAAEWVGLAKEAGMKYLVITSKHHDGFCIWDSEYTDYDITATPFARDVLRELAGECRRQGIRFATYHSIIDWHHPDYIPRGKGDPRPAETANFDRYVVYLKNQLREIITNYGPVGIMWFDGEWDPTWTHERGLDLYEYVRGLQPDIIINNRVDKGRRGMAGVTEEGFAGDYDTPEQEIGAFQRERPWESCMTLGTQWAWKPNDTVKDFKECIRTLVQTCGGDGNLLLNVGPMADGRIEPEQAQRLREMGAWLDTYGESIYGTRGGPYKPGAWGAATCKDNTIYLHVFEWTEEKLDLPALPAHVTQARLLNGGEVEVTQDAYGLTLNVPHDLQDPVDTVVVLTLDTPALEIAAIDVGL
jgi:alpha-L-fucosidase